MTKKQRSNRAKRAGAARRKANAVKAFLRKMNPSRYKSVKAVKVRKNRGGSITIIPIKIPKLKAK